MRTPAYALCAIWIAGSATVHAQTATNADDQELGRRYYQLGAELYSRADYEGALREFLQSYRLTRAPALLFNIGRCQESLGQLDQAIASYTAYLKTDPQDATTLRARLGKLQQQRARQRSIEEERRRADERRDAEKSALQRQLAETQAESRRESLHKGSLPGWILAGSGAALITVSGILGGLAAKKSKDLENLNARGAAYDAAARRLEDSGQALETGQVATLIAGGTAAIAGGLYLFFHYRKRLSERRGEAAWPIIPGPSSVTALVHF